jgi:hypothetical protein
VSNCQSQDEIDCIDHTLFRFLRLALSSRSSTCKGKRVLHSSRYLCTMVKLFGTRHIMLSSAIAQHLLIDKSSPRAEATHASSELSLKRPGQCNTAIRMIGYVWLIQKLLWVYVTTQLMTASVSALQCRSAGTRSHSAPVGTTQVFSARAYP